MITVDSFGGADTVTGSQHLLKIEGYGLVLVDAGLFQGVDQCIHRNSPKLSYNPKEIKAIILTHAHLDHCGLLPLICKKGFSGPIYTTQATKELAEIVLRDAAKIAQAEAASSNKKIKKESLKKEPLYRTQDVERVMNLVKIHPVAKKGLLPGGGSPTFEFFSAGHIPGAISVGFEVNGGKWLFSGDLGRDDDPLVRSPEIQGQFDHIYVESTYGAHLHPRGEIEKQIEGLIRHTREKGSVLLIPAFSVARSQMMALLIHRAFKKNPSLKIPVVMDSPMGLKVNKVFERHPEELKIDLREYHEIFEDIQEIEDKWQDDQLRKFPGAHIIISSSGMMTGGKVLGHFSRLAFDKDNTIFLPGYLGKGTLGAKLLAGEKTFVLEEEELEVLCKIEHSRELSAHADRDQIYSWLQSVIKNTDSSTIHLIHGEPEEKDSLKDFLLNKGFKNVFLQGFK